MTPPEPPKEGLCTRWGAMFFEQGCSFEAPLPIWDHHMQAGATALVTGRAA